MTKDDESSPTRLVDEFLRSAIPGPFDYPACHHFPGQGRHQRHVVLGFITHGNEFGTLPAARRLQDTLTEKPPLGPVTLLLGNLEAPAERSRFLDEDFNRVFTFDRPALSRERRRAEQVRPILDEADFFLDFHQTQTETTMPFWTFPFTLELGHWARAIGGAPAALTRAPDRAFSPGLMCLDEYVRERGRTGITLEVGYRGFDESQAERTWQSARNAIEAIDAIALGVSTLEQVANRMPPITYYETGHVVRTEAPEWRLRPGLSNWMELRAGEPLLADGCPELACPFDGRALFPKYPDPGQNPPPELLRIARFIDDPARAFGS